MARATKAKVRQKILLEQKCTEYVESRYRTLSDEAKNLYAHSPEFCRQMWEKQFWKSKALKEIPPAAGPSIYG